MTRLCLLHLSDLHFGTERPEVLRDLLDWAHQQRPCGWVLTGDITQRATVAQFTRARALIQALAEQGVPLLGVLPGNHDIPLFNLWQRLCSPYRRYTHTLGLPDHVPDVQVKESAGLRLILVKTTRRWRHERGELSDGQIEAVATALEAASPDQLRLVAVHQPLALPPSSPLAAEGASAHQPLPARAAMSPQDRLVNADLAIAAWQRAGCHAVLGGHVHLPYPLRLPGQPPMWVLQAGTAISSRTRAGVPNSFATLTWEVSPSPDPESSATVAVKPAGGGGAPSTQPASSGLRSARWQQWNHMPGLGFGQVRDVLLDLHH